MDTILYEVFSHLDPHDLLTCERVCKDWKKVANDNAVWTRVLEKNHDPEYADLTLHPPDLHRFLAIAVTHPRVKSEKACSVHIAALKGDMEAFSALRIYEDCCIDVGDEDGITPAEYAYNAEEYTFVEDLMSLQIEESYNRY